VSLRNWPAAGSTNFFATFPRLPQDQVLSTTTNLPSDGLPSPPLFLHPTYHCKGLISWRLDETHLHLFRHVRLPLIHRPILCEFGSSSILSTSARWPPLALENDWCSLPDRRENAFPPTTGHPSKFSVFQLSLVTSAWSAGCQGVSSPVHLE